MYMILEDSYSESQEKTRGLQVKPFDWIAWDAGCHAKGICQGYIDIPKHETKLEYTNMFQVLEEGEWHAGYAQHELHHRDVAPALQGIAKSYWQCPHCRQLQKPIQWAQHARLETYQIAQRGHRLVLWLKISSGAWFVLIVKAYHSIQAVATDDSDCGTAYYCGTPGVAAAKTPQQLPDEIAVTLARRFWHKITKGSWSNVPNEEEE